MVRMASGPVEIAPCTVETPGGRIEVRWKPEAAATAQLAFFAKVLTAIGGEPLLASAAVARQYSAGAQPASVLDIDTTVKTLYGRQQDVEVGWSSHY